VQEGASLQGETGTGENSGTGTAPSGGAQSGFSGGAGTGGRTMTVGQRAMNGVLGFFGLATRSVSAADFGNVQTAPPQ
jgi:hypothetical protein